MLKEIWYLIVIFDIYLCLQFLSFLVFSKNNNLIRYILTGLLLIACLIAINLLGILLGIEEFKIEHVNPLVWLAGPLFYFLVKSLIDAKSKIGYGDLFHALPFAGALGCALITECDPGFLQKIQVIAEIKICETPELLLVMQNLLYAGLIYKNWSRSKKTPGVHSGKQLVVIELIKLVYLGFCGLMICILLTSTWLPEVHDFSTLIILMYLHVAIIYLTYILSTHHKLFEKSASTKTIKYKKSKLTENQYQKYLQLLTNYMEKEKPYLDNSLKLADLAKKIKLSPNVLSQVINSKLNKNFFDFINEYRLNEMLIKLKDPKYYNYTIFGVAQESGFKNKHTLNKVFKNRMGISPSEFVKRN